MHSKIRKRDGRYVRFNTEKITNAIEKAGEATGEFDVKGARKLAIKGLNLAEKIFGDRIMSVEDVQDIVEEVLLSSPYRKTAKRYIIYRDQHARLREMANKMEIDLVDQYLKKIDWKINENSNMAYSLQVPTPRSRQRGCSNRAHGDPLPREPP
jgi:ribonucleoside-triphosphate reductase